MTTTTIRAADGGSFSAYVARPAGDAPAKAAKPAAEKPAAEKPAAEKKEKAAKK